MKVSKKEKAVEAKGFYNLKNFKTQFEENYPFSITQVQEFLREAEGYIRDQVIELVSSYKDLPRVLELDLKQDTDLDQKPFAKLWPNSIFRPKLKITILHIDGKAEQLKELGEQVSNLLEKNVVDSFFDHRIEYLLTQKIVKADRKKKAA